MLTDNLYSGLKRSFKTPLYFRPTGIRKYQENENSILKLLTDTLTE